MTPPARPDAAPLSIEIVDGRLVIAIGIKTLGEAVTSDCGPFDGLGLRVTEHHIFAQEVMRQLKREDHDGTTPVHVLLDKAAFDAWENGAEGIANA